MLALRSSSRSGRTSPASQVCEHLPKLAKCADKYAILRGVSHTLAGHELGTEYLNTGSRPVPSLVYPGYGAVVSKELPGRRRPAALRRRPDHAAEGRLPRRALRPAADQRRPGSRPAVRRPRHLAGRRPDRRAVREAAEAARPSSTRPSTGRGRQQAGRRAGPVRAAGVRHDHARRRPARRSTSAGRSREAAKPFGESQFGMSCLLALRLIEAGVRFVTVTFGGWDTHANNFQRVQDEPAAAARRGAVRRCSAALSERGLLDSTLVFVTGEFGRTPKVNDRAGRDHWPRAMSVLLAGGGVKGGQVIGESDAKGMGPAGDAHHAGPGGGVVLPRPGHRPEEGVPHQHRPAGADRPRRDGRSAGCSGERWRAAPVRVPRF